MRGHERADARRPARRTAVSAEADRAARACGRPPAARTPPVMPGPARPGRGAREACAAMATWAILRRGVASSAITSRDDVHDDVEGGEDEHDELDHRDVPVGDRVDQALADAGEVEHVLDDDDAARQVQEVEADNLDRWARSRSAARGRGRRATRAHPSAGPSPRSPTPGPRPWPRASCAGCRARSRSPAWPPAGRAVPAGSRRRCPGPAARPRAGRARPRWRSKMIRAIATTNSGSEVTARTITERTWSNQPSLRSAAMAPRITPASALMAPVTTTRTAELMILGSTRPHTGSPLLRDWPRLPVNSAGYPDPVLVEQPAVQVQGDLERYAPGPGWRRARGSRSRRCRAALRWPGTPRPTPGTGRPRRWPAAAGSGARWGARGERRPAGREPRLRPRRPWPAEHHATVLIGSGGCHVVGSFRSGRDMRPRRGLIR